MKNTVIFIGRSLALKLVKQAAVSWREEETTPGLQEGDQKKKHPDSCTRHGKEGYRPKVKAKH